MYTNGFIKHMSWRGSNHLQQSMVTPTESVMVEKIRLTTYFLFTIPFSHIYTLPFLSMTLPWEFFRLLTWRRPNCTPIRGWLFRRFEFFVIFLRLFPLPNLSCFITIPIRVLPWVGCLWQVDRGVFDSQLSLPQTKNLKKNISKYLWNQMAETIFMIWRDKQNFFSIGPEILPKLPPGRGRRCRHWTRQFLFVFCYLLCKFPTRELVALYESSKRWTNFTGM